MNSIHAQISLYKADTKHSCFKTWSLQYRLPKEAYEAKTYWYSRPFCLDKETKKNGQKQFTKNPNKYQCHMVASCTYHLLTITILGESLCNYHLLAAQQETYKKV